MRGDQLARQWHLIQRLARSHYGMGLDDLAEFSIGHAIVGRAVLVGYRVFGTSKSAALSTSSAAPPSAEGGALLLREDQHRMNDLHPVMDVGLDDVALDLRQPGLLLLH